MCRVARFFAFVLTAISICESPALADGMSKQEMTTYMVALQDDEKLIAEVGFWGEKLPIVSAYFLALFAGEPCKLPKASEKLRVAANPDFMATTVEGQKSFIVMGMAASRKYPTAEAQDRFCQHAAELQRLAEKMVGN